MLICVGCAYTHRNEGVKQQFNKSEETFLFEGTEPLQIFCLFKSYAEAKYFQNKTLGSRKITII